MKFDKVIIKQIPDNDSLTASGLGKYNRSRFPKCVDLFSASLLPDGRFLTGIDPTGYEVTLIKDESLREQKKTELQEVNETLHRLLPNVDLSPTSSYWETFRVGISTDQELILNRINPVDILKYHLLIENGYVAPTKDAIGDPRYRDAKYYCHVDEVEAREKISSQKLRDKAVSELSAMSDNKDKMLLIGKYLEGTKYKDRMLTDTIYSNLREYIEDKKNPENVEAFLRATKKSVEDLQFKVTIDIALRKKIIRYSGGQYTRGGVNLGKSPAAVIENLKQPEYAAEFAQIYNEVNGQ